MSSFKIGVIGDLHTHWDDIDVAQFASTSYDLLFFTGDLGGGTPESTLRVARKVSQLNRETLVMPGNNDTNDITELAAELSHQVGLRSITAIRNGDGASLPSKPQVQLCGYSLHQPAAEHLPFTIIAGRPHSMGGEALSFTEHMQLTYGIGSMAESTERLTSLVDAAPHDNLVFFSHNGPTGLGAEPEAMWGCDFKPGGGDWGDPDLRIAIDYAKQSGKRVLAVIAGHMHLRTKGGRERAWNKRLDETLYVNAARVPRIYSSDDVYRHHVCLTVGAEQAEAEEVQVPQYGG